MEENSYIPCIGYPLIVIWCISSEFTAQEENIGEESIKWDEECPPFTYMQKREEGWRWKAEKAYVEKKRICYIKSNDKKVKLAYL